MFRCLVDGFRKGSHNRGVEKARLGKFVQVESVTGATTVLEWRRSALLLLFFSIEPQEVNFCRFLLLSPEMFCGISVPERSDSVSFLPERRPKILRCFIGSRSRQITLPQTKKCRGSVTVSIEVSNRYQRISQQPSSSYEKLSITGQARIERAKREEWKS